MLQHFFSFFIIKTEYLLKHTIMREFKILYCFKNILPTSTYILIATFLSNNFHFISHADSS